MEIRSNELETLIPTTEDTAKPMLIGGYAAVFNEKTKLFSRNGVDYFEIIEPTAFANCNVEDVVLRYNHKDNTSLLARTSNNSLSLKVDEKGLYIEAELANTTQGRDMYELIKRGDINKMSFGFIVDQEKYQGNTRHIISIKALKDVSLVDFPAYDTTTVEALFRAKEEAEQKEAEAVEREKLETVLRSY